MSGVIHRINSAPLLPTGLAQAHAWAARFKRVAALRGQRAAWRYALSPGWREALEDSFIEHLPPTLRCPAEPLRIVDVGANTGHWLACLRRFLPVQAAACFEPNPDALRRLTARWADDSRVTVFPVACGRASGVETLYATGNSSFASLLAPAPLLHDAYDHAQVAVKARHAIAVQRLDDALREQAGWDEDAAIDLLKIDVQGYELEALAGAQETLARSRCVAIEANFQPHYHAAPTFERIWSALRGSGFALYTLSDPFRAPDGRALWADAVFVRDR